MWDLVESRERTMFVTVGSSGRAIGFATSLTVDQNKIQKLKLQASADSPKGGRDMMAMKVTLQSKAESR